MRIFLDDERVPEQVFWMSCDGDWIVVRNHDDFQDHVLDHGLPTFISFDHDLGMFSESGYECAKFLVEYCLHLDKAPTFDFQVHSMNPVGKRNIECLLNNFKDQYV